MEPNVNNLAKAVTTAWPYVGVLIAFTVLAVWHLRNITKKVSVEAERLRVASDATKAFYKDVEKLFNDKNLSPYLETFVMHLARAVSVKEEGQKILERMSAIDTTPKLDDKLKAELRGMKRRQRASFIIFLCIVNSSIVILSQTHKVSLSCETLNKVNMRKFLRKLLSVICVDVSANSDCSFDNAPNIERRAA